MSALLPVAAPRAQAELAGNLVYLRDVDASIQQDIRYSSGMNFTGAPLDGYNAAECVLTRPAAAALALVQADLKPRGLTLKVYDCYRPKRATRAMMRWVGAPGAAKATSSYHPSLPRGKLVALGYIASVSGHARGDTLDLTIVPAEAPPLRQLSGQPGPCTGPVGTREPDTSVDMGTGFDCFDTKSNTRAAGLTAEQRRWRETLVGAMQQRGFANYAKEWWHFTLKGQRGQSYDVPITPRR